jgi:hypothetical protein
MNGKRALTPFTPSCKLLVRDASSTIKLSHLLCPLLLAAHRIGCFLFTFSLWHYGSVEHVRGAERAKSPIIITDLKLRCHPLFAPARCDCVQPFSE